MDPKSKETARRQSLSLLCACVHMSFFAFRGLLCFGLALAVEFFELFQLFRALGEGLGGAGGTWRRRRRVSVLMASSIPAIL